MSIQQSTPAMTIPLPSLPIFQAETLPARFKRLAMGAKPKQIPSKFYGPNATSTRKRSPLSRCLSANLPPAPRTIYSLNSQVRFLSRSVSMPSSNFASQSTSPVPMPNFVMPENEHASNADTAEPSTPKSRMRSSLWISMPNTPPESQSPPPILSSKLNSRKRLRFKRSRTLEWACAKDSKHTPRQLVPMSDDEGEFNQPFSARLSFPGRRGLGIITGQDAMELDSSANWNSPSSQSSRRSSWSSTASTEDEMEVTTPTGSTDEISSYLPDIVITAPNGVSGIYDVSYADQELGVAKVSALSNEDEAAATILMQLRHHASGR